jgi:hypothetical protein
MRSLLRPLAEPERRSQLLSNEASISRNSWTSLRLVRLVTREGPRDDATPRETSTEARRPALPGLLLCGFLKKASASPLPVILPIELADQHGRVHASSEPDCEVRAQHPD